MGWGKKVYACCGEPEGKPHKKNCDSTQANQNRDKLTRNIQPRDRRGEIPNANSVRGKNVNTRDITKAEYQDAISTGQHFDQVTDIGGGKVRVYWYT
jgi:hypothetical protein